MCGLVGVYGDLLAVDLKFFKNSLIADYVRGVHSTGIAACTPEEVEIKKLAIDPINFLDLSSVKDMLTLTQHALMGHNRQATKGAINNVNAHPFQHGAITLMHNGTLTNKWQLERDFQAPTFDTDSELVCWLIDNYELDCVIKALEGAFALTWWDSSDNTINIIHNGEREFHLADVQGTLYWASEKLMLKWVLDRACISDDKTKIISPKIGRHCKFKWSRKGGMTVETEDMELAPVKKPTTRTGTTSTKVATTTGTANITTQSEAIEMFAQEHGFRPEQGTKVYAYLNAVNTPYSAGAERVQLDCTLAADPYCSIKVHYTPRDDMYSPDDLYGIMLEVKSVSESNGKFYLTGNPLPSAIVPFGLTAHKEIKEMDDWIQDNLPPFERQEDTAEDLVAGYQGKMLPFKKFASVLSRGCAVCGSTFDIDAEAADRSCSFVSDDDAICSGCASDEATLRYYGFDVTKTGTK